MARTNKHNTLSELSSILNHCQLSVVRYQFNIGIVIRQTLTLAESTRDAYIIASTANLESPKYRKSSVSPLFPGILNRLFNCAPLQFSSQLLGGLILCYNSLFLLPLLSSCSAPSCPGLRHGLRSALPVPRAPTSPFPLSFSLASQNVDMLLRQVSRCPRHHRRPPERALCASRTRIADLRLAGQQGTTIWLSSAAVLLVTLRPSRLVKRV